jgi:hypothetical protein
VKKMPSEQEVVGYLSQFQPGKLPFPVFNEIARILVTTVVEIIPLRIKNSQIEILFLEREESDPHWAGQLHTPGTIILSTDKEGDFTSAFERILEGELNGTAAKSSPVFYGVCHQQNKRGRGIALLHYVEMSEDEPKAGTYFTLDNLPDTMVDSQEAFIREAVEHFLKHRN